MEATTVGFPNMIRLSDPWLEETGFYAWDPVLVKCENGKPVTAQSRAEMIETEKTFMKKEVPERKGGSSHTACGGAEGRIWKG